MNQIKIILLDRVREFLKSLNPKILSKIYANMQKVQEGVNDKDIFKKTYGHRFLGVPNTSLRDELSPYCLLG